MQLSVNSVDVEIGAVVVNSVVVEIGAVVGEFSRC